MRHDAELAAVKVRALPTRRPWQIGMRRANQINQLITYLLIFIFLAIAIMPLLWVISTSLQTPDQLRITYPIQWIPNPIYFANYPDGWQQQPWLLYLRNTLIVAIGSGIGEIVSTTPVAYAFARMRFAGRNFMILLNISLM